MTNVTKYLTSGILGIVIGVLLVLLTSQPQRVVPVDKPDTVRTVQENVFTAEQVGSIKKILVDSLEAIYKKSFPKTQVSESVKPEPPALPDAQAESSPGEEYAYISEIDTFFVVKDSSGRTTDSMRVVSTFISSEPIPEQNLHLVSLHHYSTSETITIPIEKGNFGEVKVGTNVSFGYGLINKQWDVYAGVGVQYNFDISNFF